jgi:hypothetical protein
MAEERVLSTPETARRFGITEAQVRAMANKLQPQPARIGRCRVFTAADLRRLERLLQAEAVAYQRDGD